MKKLSLILICIGIATIVSAQKIMSDPIITMTLSNGMNVVLCEDHGQPRIYGAVCVHAGGKNDPADNTGMAHYLEHIMFKGTDRLGTLDWEQEKPILDEISQLYDNLHETSDKQQREDILDKISTLSNDATQYAIPNEVDVVLSKMGGQGVNAFTSNDVTVYHNSFPSNQLSKWLKVYTERFRYPVFRLFQTELEAVYEEYNMYQDQQISVFMEDALAQAYGEHPYGRPVIGYQKHLKNPQISAMQKFFNTYYHPCNMTLVLVGDFNSMDIKPLLESTIGSYHNEAEGVDPKWAKSTKRMNTDLRIPVKPFQGQQIVQVKETPVKMGVIGYQTIGSHDKNEFYLNVLSSFLNNEEETGLLDKLNKDNKLLGASAINYSMLEHGMFGIFYVPKIIGQSHAEAEAYIFAALDSLRKGNFSDDLYEAVKMSYLKDFLQEMETLDDKFNVVLGMVTSKLTPKDISDRENLIRNMTKADIVNLANQVFSENYMIFRSDMGSKEQEKLQKPKWKTLVARNTESSSDFAKELETEPVSPILPQTLSFTESVNENEIVPNFKFYGSPNPYNDYFSMVISYNYGQLDNRLLSTAVDYINQQGTRNMSYDEFQMALQKLGATMSLSSTDNKLYVSITGFDKDIAEIVKLCHNKIFFPGNDESVLKKLIDDKVGGDKMTKNDASTWGRALYYYALYGKDSPYLTRVTTKELKKMTGMQLIDAFCMAMKYDGSITYVGNADNDKLIQLLRETMVVPDPAPGKNQVRQPLQTEPIIYLASNKKFVQSNIYFLKTGVMLFEPKQREDCRLYNEYMGGSMAGVVFQEIRELRSLGYSAYARYDYDYLNRRPGFLMGFLGTQTDKTVEGCQAMSELLTKFPSKPEKFEMAKTSCLRSLEADYVQPRNIPAQIRTWQEQGFDKDPRVERIKILQEKKLKDIENFYNNSVGNAPLVITIAGDKSRINLKELSGNYKIKELKYKDFIKE